jgi:class 3 adenylate cyclase
MDIGGWLRSLGLERYEAVFRENEITEKVLPNLTAEDLRDLGVVTVGHRRTLLDAIAVLRAYTSAKALPSDAIPSIDTSPKDTAERRQITVMFADLAGSTALSARMDPEDLREVISAYQKCVAETVARFGGFVAKYMGDGVLVYFGYPQAHEDDAERAVRAGLELIEAVGGLKSSAPLQTRVGIATGLVLVGDLIGSGASQEQAVVGETPNVAARLQGIAEANTVVIAESTRKLLGSLFELQDLGAKEVKGIASPVRAWAVLRPASIESRFEALHASGLTELVGREEEIELLLRRWSRAKDGEGQVVLLSGEAGIGKSRLTAALLEHLAGKPHTPLRYFCSPQHTDSALYPVIGQMERAAGFVHDDTPEAKLDKLDAVLARTSTRMEDVVLFAEMLSLPNDLRYPALELTPEQRRQKTLEALVSQMEALTRQNPVLMIFEDAHWTDPTSLELFGRVIDRIRTHRVLLIVTFRSEFQAPWVGRPYVTALTINRLAERDIETIIDRVVGNKLLPADVRQDIIQRTDGIPLFVEEMTKAVLEAGSEDAGQRTAAATSATRIHCGNYAAANAEADEVVALADQKSAVYWKAFGMMNQGCVLALTGKASEAVQVMSAGITAYRSTGATVFMPWWLPQLARAHAELGQVDDACRCIGEAMTALETNKERCWEAEVNRVTGEIALMSPENDVAKAQAYFERALTIARQQQARSWELRAAMSMARLWRDQGKRDEARSLLAPVYGWFTEGFDTLDLKEAKALLGELNS